MEHSELKECSHAFIIELPEISADDQLLKEKLDLIGHRGNYFKLPTCWVGDGLQCSELFDLLLRIARIMTLNEVEWYFMESGDVGPFSPRNELEALNLILSSLSRYKDHEEAKSSVLPLLEIVMNKLSSFPVPMDILRLGVMCDGEKETALLNWALRHGIKCKLDIAVFEGFGRGGRAIDDISVGEVVLEIPQSLIICDATLKNSDMVSVLKDMDGISKDTMSLLWSMTERHNPQSLFAPYFASLPDFFNTGLSLGLNALRTLDGTTQLEEIIQAKEHLRLQYNSLFPTLSNLFPQLFPNEFYTWDMFLWACELWYSNGLKISFPDGTMKTCLIPIAGLLNHGVYPHITRYGRLEPQSGTLVLRAARPCKAGEQCLMSYGAFTNSHLLTFYGFLLKSDNPFDIIPIDLDLSDAPHRHALMERSNLGHSHMIRGSWFSPSQTRPYGLPRRLLAALYIMLMQEEDAKISPSVPQVFMKRSEIEVEVYELLISMVTNMLDSLGEPPSPEEGIETHEWDLALALSYKDSQRKLLQSVCMSCSMALQDLAST